ncbi:MAG: TPM domain-containing protein [Bacteroidales bacterium]|nr:TPM domain-containing protein [Bacteroidales bacterium]
MRYSVLIILFLGLSVQLFSKEWTVSSVPNPKKNYGGFVSNPDGVLSETVANQINAIITNLESNTQIEIAVVVLNDIGNAVPKNFATELFNSWGIGKQGLDNGLLILTVINQRRVEFETGYGLEHILTDSYCFRIQQLHMVPHFKNENYDLGLLNGVEAVEALLVRGEIAAADSTFATNSNYIEENNDLNYIEENSSETTYASKWEPFYLFFLIYGFLYFLYFVIFLIVKYKVGKIADLHKRYHSMNAYAVWVWMFFFPIAAIPIYIYVKKQRSLWRNSPRISPNTGEIMFKLDETDEDAYLKSGQITEEQIRSVDYDVWISGIEGDVLILPYKRMFNNFNACPKCSFITYKLQKDTVLKSPTTISTGVGERTYECKHCKYIKVETYVIAKVSKSSSGGRSGGSSSGGSFGGGRSGGGGSGSSW